MSDKQTGASIAGLADAKLASRAASTALALLITALVIAIVGQIAGPLPGLSQITQLVTAPAVQLAVLAVLAISLYAMRRSHARELAQARDGTADVDLGESDYVRMAYTDELTGLPNRRRFEQRLETLAARRRETGKPFGVALINLDGFKPINDVYGHSAGDEILCQVALRLRGGADSFGTVARFGGDEFAVLAPELASEEEATQLATVLSEIVSAPYDLEGRRVRLSGSFGLALYPDCGSEGGQLLERAETALYRAKKQGRGHITVFTKDIEDALNQEAQVEQALRQAIADNAIQPFFQPIVDLKDGRVLGFEALARWHDRELGQVSPAKFIPIAEERGMIGELTDRLLYRAAREATLWPGNTFLSFNLSTAQLADPGTGLKVLSILSRAGLDPRRLEIEVTETAVMSDPDMAREIIGGLRAAGVRVALDDFGTGHSSLGYLRQLTLDKVKIDRCFVMGVGHERESEYIIRAILEMCTGLHLNVVAEGIEESLQAEVLRSFGCGAGQGYLFGKPMEADKAGQFCLPAGVGIKVRGSIDHVSA
jgi:diguanylate cyclase (GGDEF)-like protein